MNAYPRKLGSVKRKENVIQLLDLKTCRLSLTANPCPRLFLNLCWRRGWDPCILTPVTSTPVPQETKAWSF